MKKQPIKNIVKYSAHELPVDTKTDWKRVDAMTYKQVEENAQADIDSLIANNEFWQIAQLVMPSEINKERITIRIDADILGWLKHRGRGYQSRINSILRAFMKTEKIHHNHKKNSHHRHAN